MSFESFARRPKVEQQGTVLPNEQQYQRGEFINKGGNSTAYEVKDQPDKVALAIGNIFGGENAADSLQKSLDRLHQKIEKYASLPEGTNAPKILKAWTENGSLLEVMERAKGHPIHDRKGDFEQWQRELEVLANVPDEHYAKFLADLNVLEAAGFVIDPSKPDNFFYDLESGFHFIDLEIRDDTTPPVTTSDRMIVPLIHTSNLFNKYGNQLSPAVKEAVQKIIDKATRTGIVNPNGIPGDIERLQEIERKININTAEQKVMVEKINPSIGNDIF